MERQVGLVSFSMLYHSGRDEMLLRKTVVHIMDIVEDQDCA